MQSKSQEQTIKEQQEEIARLKKRLDSDQYTLQLEAEKAEAEAASRAKSAFIANVSHDIRTPLSGLIGLSELLQHEMPYAEQKELARMLSSSGEQLLGMLNRVLELIDSELDVHPEPTPLPFNFETLLNELVNLEKPALIEKKLKLNIKLDKIPKQIICDKRLVFRILLNLLSNAIRFSNKGSIHIKAWLGEKSLNKAMLYCQIDDQGQGIETEQINRLFDPRYQYSAYYGHHKEGQGMGLTIVKNHIRQLKGHIDVQSKPGKGTTVLIRLPVALPQLNSLFNEASPQIREIAADNDTSSGNKARILLVEDNKLALKVARKLLEHYHIEVISAHSIAEAMELIHHESFDLLLTDIGLPDGNGFDLCQALREYEQQQQLPAHPVVGLGADVEFPETAETVEMDLLIDKPLTPEKIETELFVLLNLLPGTSSHDRLPLFEPEKALENFGGYDALADLLTMFHQHELPSHLQQIQTAVEKNQPQDLRQILHRFKSTCLYCSLTRLHAFTREWEQSLEHSKVNQSQLLRQFSRLCEETSGRTEQWLEDFSRS